MPHLSQPYRIPIGLNVNAEIKSKIRSSKQIYIQDLEAANISQKQTELWTLQTKIIQSKLVCLIYQVVVIQ